MKFINLPDSAFTVRSTGGGGSRCWGPINLLAHWLAPDLRFFRDSSSLPDGSVCRAGPPSHMPSWHLMLFLRAHTTICTKCVPWWTRPIFPQDCLPMRQRCCSPSRWRPVREGALSKQRCWRNPLVFLPTPEAFPAWNAFPTAPTWYFELLPVFGASAFSLL